MFNLNILKSIQFLIRKQRQGGWQPDTQDNRDYQFINFFKDDIFGASIPREFERNYLQLPRISHQQNTLSCVCNSFSFANAFNSKQNDNNDVFFSWRFLYANATRYQSGTTFRDNGQVLRRLGQPLDNLMPQKDWQLANNQSQEKGRITQDILNNAENFKIQTFFYVNNQNINELKIAVMKSPVIIAVFSNNNAWSKDIIRYDGNKQFGHAIVIVGYNEDYWTIADWQGDETFRKLDINHPIASACILLDLPDAVGAKTMMRTLKVENKKEIWLLFNNGKLQHIRSMEQYLKGIEKKVWKPFELISELEASQYPIDTTNPLVFNL